MIRFATTDDMVWLLEMLYQFHQESPYKHLPLNEEYVTAYLTGILEADKNQTILLIAEDFGQRQGFLSATKTIFPLTGDPIAAELAWWVAPEYRGSSVAASLKEALERWAYIVGCKSVQMTALTNKYHDALSRYYKKSGYTHAETSFLKGI